MNGFSGFAFAGLFLLCGLSALASERSEHLLKRQPSVYASFESFDLDGVNRRIRGRSEARLLPTPPQPFSTAGFLSDHTEQAVLFPEHEALEWQVQFLESKSLPADGFVLKMFMNGYAGGATAQCLLSVVNDFAQARENDRFEVYPCDKDVATMEVADGRSSPRLSLVFGSRAVEVFSAVLPRAMT